MKMNAAGISLIKEFEGLRLKAYQDEHGIWTIGWGHTLGVHPDMVITLEKAEELFSKDLAFAEQVVNHHVTVPITQNQYSALVSFVYNEGPGKFMCSTLLRKLLSGDAQGAADQFPRWDKVHRPDGVVVMDAGLARRRKEERELFLTKEQA